MAKFEINNPVALKFIADFKSGILFRPLVEKIRKIKWILISILLFIAFLVFYNIGKSLFQKTGVPIFTPPSLDSDRVISPPRQSSEYDSLKEEIINFSSDLPDPVMPDLVNEINLKKEEI